MNKLLIMRKITGLSAEKFAKIIGVSRKKYQELEDSPDLCPGQTVLKAKADTAHYLRKLLRELSDV